ncbi:MAG TPA: ABC transporter ATP-binding protein [Cytophagaceae bacterium]|jgi:subfamily B ATP-binding cassette protein MsbA|nr:ABC transporter ATP-binding protein [Cytophagaceae bacterium]
MKTFLRIISFARPFQRYAVPYAIFSIIAILFGLFNFSVIMPVLDILFGTTKDPSNYILPEASFSMAYLKAVLDYYSMIFIQEYGKPATLVIICLVLAFSNLLANLFKYLSLRVTSSVKAVVLQNIRRDLYYKITNLHIGFFSNERKGDLMSRVTNDVYEIEYSIIGTLTVLFRDPITVIIYFTVLFMLDWKLTLYTLIILPASGFLISLISKKLKKESDAGQVTLANILNVTEETISGLRIIKAFNGEKFIRKKFDQENDGYADLIRSMSNKRELSSPLSEFMGVCLVGVILWIGGNMVFTGELEPSEFFFFIISFYQILVPVKGIAGSMTNIQRGISAGERIFRILDAPNEIIDKPNATDIKAFNQHIAFKNVSFAYGDTAILKNINIEITKGKTIALIGPSGGGKSTLADLIPRFYDVVDGEITLDGLNIKDISLHSLRNQIGVVSQESILFNDTIYNNIAFSTEDVTEEKVIQAAKIANAHEFILQTENGYHTNIGDRGMKLSGGQRQRISIARAILKNPPILILDEATSALDNESERLVQDALNQLMKNRTSLVIAHRLSTIQNADEILVLEKGSIIEQGNHQELMAKKGLYNKLYNLYNDTGIIE